MPIKIFLWAIRYPILLGSLNSIFLDEIWLRLPFGEWLNMAFQAYLIAWAAWLVTKKGDAKLIDALGAAVVVTFVNIAVIRGGWLVWLSFTDLSQTNPAYPDGTTRQEILLSALAVLITYTFLLPVFALLGFLGWWVAKRSQKSRASIT